MNAETQTNAALCSGTSSFPVCPAQPVVKQTKNINIYMKISWLGL